MALRSLRSIFFVARNCHYHGGHGSVLFDGVYRDFPNVLVLLFVLRTGYAFVTSQSWLVAVFMQWVVMKSRQALGCQYARLLFIHRQMGVLAALAGLIVAARLNSATTQCWGRYGIGCYAACSLGVIGERRHRYRHRRSGGAFRIGVWNNGMSILDLGSFAKLSRVLCCCLRFYLMSTTRIRVSSK